MDKAKETLFKKSESKFEDFTKQKFNCSICLIIRDENEYLKEWLEWHINQGVEHFYIYDHGSKQSVKSFTNQLSLSIRNKLTITDWSGPHENAQPQAYNDCLKRFGNDNKWIGFIDADEHVRVKTGQSLPDFLNAYLDYAGLFIVWVTYGACGQKYKSDLPLRKRFPYSTSAKTWSDKMGKVFVQPEFMESMYIHNGYPKEGYSIVGESHDWVAKGEFWKENATTDLICVDHYYTKSYEEWLEKLKRGRSHVNHGRKYEEFFDYNDDMEYCRENILLTQEYESSTKENNFENIYIPKILLKIDKLNGKIIEFKESWEIDENADLKEKDLYIREIKQFDCEIDYNFLTLFIDAQNQNKDVYFDNNKLILKEKEPNEYHNMVTKFKEEIKLKEKYLSDLQEKHYAKIHQKKIKEIRKIQFQYYCSICLLIRDENEYLEEWLYWHINQGVQHFFIFDNGSVFPVIDFVKSLSKDIQNKVTVVNFNGKHKHLQHEAYAECLKKFGNDSRWIGFIDSDEMVNIKDGTNILNFLHEYEDYAGLFIPWVIYDANGHRYKNNLPCRERFTHTTSLNLWPGMGKVFIQPYFMRNMMIHNGYPIEGFVVVDENKIPIENAAVSKPDITYDRICIDHFYTKSHQEWVEKMWRGSCDPDYCRKYDEFFHFNPDMIDYYENGIPTQEYESSLKFNDDMKLIKQTKIAEVKPSFKTIKLLLKLDPLTNKVIEHREYWKIDNKADFNEKDRQIREMMQYDITVETNINYFTNAKQAKNEVYYENGKLLCKPKNPKDYYNSVIKIFEAIEELKKEEIIVFNALSEKHTTIDEEKFKSIKIRKEEMNLELTILKQKYIEKIRNKKMLEIQQLNFKYYCSLCLIIRDENEYLEEWLVWHINQGVQHFYIYDHGSREPVLDFIQTLDINITKMVTVIDHSGQHDHAQHEAYNNCLKEFRKESRWIGFVDSDEMIRIKEQSTLPIFLKEFEEYAGLFMLWIVYNANGHKDKLNLPCRERFTKQAIFDLWPGMGKVFVQPYFMRNMMIHNGYTIDGFHIVNELKKPVEIASITADNATSDRICVDHYYTKSHEEWIEKIQRGSCDANYSRKYDEFFYFNPDLAEFRVKTVPVQMYEVSTKLNEKIKKSKQDELKNFNFKYYCSICLIIRDENEYLEEWLRWHIGQGVEHFYIYDHSSKNSVAEFIQSLGMGLTEKVTMVDWSGLHKNAQPDAYNDCLNRFNKESRWIGFIDTDEHVRVKTGQSLPMFLKDYEDFAGLFMVWITYDSNGQKEKSNLPLRKRFRNPALIKTWSDKMGKIFVQPFLMKDMYIHSGHPIEGFDIVGEAKDLLPFDHFWKDNATTNLICVDHYFTKSYEEWLEKLMRGTAHSQYQRKYEDFFELNPYMEYCRENTAPIQIYNLSSKKVVK